MADEVRRSGRATKGQHTKNIEDDLPPAKRQQKGKGNSKGKKATSNEPEPEPVEGDGDAVIRCICGATEDDEGLMMIVCEACDAWQHNLCMGVTEDEEKLGEVDYYCEICRPAEHVELLAAIKRGEKPWLEKKRRREEEEKQKKAKKGKRKSRPSALPVEETPVKPVPLKPTSAKPTPAKSTPPVQEPSNKRKFEAVDGTNGQHQPPPPPPPPLSASPTVATTPAPANPRRKPSTAPAVESAAKRRKSGAEIQQPRRDSTAPPLLDSIDNLPVERQKVTKLLQRDIKPLIDKAAKDGLYRVPDGETSTSLANSLSLKIEYALISHFGDVASYSSQFRSIHFNIKKNPELLQRLLSGSLLPEALPEMSTDDMASADLQRQRAAMKEEADKQAILAHEQGPRIRKTHKGEEVIGGDESRPAEEPDYTTAPIRRRPTQDESATEQTPPEEPSSPHMVELPEDVGRPPLTVDTSGAHARKASNFDISRAWKSAHSPDQPQGAFQTPRRAEQGPQDVNMQDADIDRLLKDEDMDDAPISPIADGSSANWKGRIDMAGVAAFNGTARWVAGGDVGQKIPYSELVPQRMEITGRIAINRADEYVSGMRYSQTTDVCVLALTPSNSATDREGFTNIFDYFHTKDRWGVIAQPHFHEAIRDVYVVTLEAGLGGLPEFMQMLQEKNIEEPRPSNMLLLTLVVKTKSPPSSVTPGPTPHAPSETPIAAPALPGAQPPPQASPVVPQGAYGNGNQPNAPITAATAPPAGVAPEAVVILGPFINAPVVMQILQAVPNMSEQQLINLRDVLEREPATREDIGKLGEHLQRRNQEVGMGG